MSGFVRMFCGVFSFKYLRFLPQRLFSKKNIGLMNANNLCNINIIDRARFVGNILTEPPLRYCDKAPLNGWNWHPYSCFPSFCSMFYVEIIAGIWFGQIQLLRTPFTYEYLYHYNFSLTCFQKTCYKCLMVKLSSVNKCSIVAVSTKKATAGATTASSRARVKIELTKALSLENESVSSIEMHCINPWRTRIETLFCCKTKFPLEYQHHRDC